MCFLSSSIHWRKAEVLVRRTKAKRDRVVPLLQESGEALADYVLHARPKSDSQRVFLQHVPPVRPIDGSAVISRIVRSALERGGLELPRVAGASGASQPGHAARHATAPNQRDRGSTGPSQHRYDRHLCEGGGAATRRRRPPIPGRCGITSFAKTLADRVEAFTTLRRSLGYSFQKQASVLRALVRYVETEHIDP